MKLYTEEQVIKAIDFSRLQGSEPYLVKYREEEILNMITPIELPSDEEIEIEALSFCNSQEISSDTSYYGFLGACQWFLRKIQGGNK